MEQPYDQLSSLFRALAHPARLRILDLLRGGELCVCHIEAALNKRQAYVSQQLMALREAGLVGSRRDGLQVFYWITDKRVMRLLDDLLGEAESSVPVIPGCTCPSCVVVSMTEVG